MDTKDYYVLLSMVEGLGARWIAALDKVFGGPDRVWHAPEANLQEIPKIPKKVISDLLAKRSHLKPEVEFRRFREQGIQTIFIEEDSYPDNLRHIFDPPKILWVRGNPAVLRQPMFGVVGARGASHYGLSVAHAIARDVAQAGLCIVSGMARGIDSAAHQGALSIAGPTVAVLGCGVDVVYPRENKSLMKEIIEKGAVISEFPPGTAPVAGNFPVRNRIISGLCQGILVVEAAEKSGSLITADLALEQGRDVFAVPGQVTNPLSKGAHRLIKQGAKLVEDGGDILEELGYPGFTPGSGRVGQQLDLTANEEKIYNMISDEPVSSETIISQAGFTPSEVLALLLHMEIKGLIRQLSGHRYVRSL